MLVAQTFSESNVSMNMSCFKKKIEILPSCIKAVEKLPENSVIRNRETKETYIKFINGRFKNI